MFLDPATHDIGFLRQGDLLKEVHFLGALSFADITVPTPVAGEAALRQWTVNQQLSSGFVMVMSHCCEIATQNGVKLTTVILAPLRDVAKATEPKRVAELKQSNFVDRDNPAASYLKYFYVEANPLLPFHDGAIADFSKCFSVRKTSYDLLLSKKILQMDEEARFNMSLKLALYFHRNQAAA